ncbi:DNA polymerase III subunit gamma/tau [Candidatus Gottesmanbacteria bacterium]|nr:DNA polymerase III subunit gamma/tau [Candidatus Gottesmanbacteria bacterium]
MVLYRKYRPQKIAEIDNSAVKEKLEIILSRGAAPHAFLFSGPKGTGKTSAARIIAKSLNCEKNNGRGEPCGRCGTCISITNGTNLDVLEIDAASNRGIDEIRDLREKIRLAPAAVRKKVYIVDEAHMLTTEAANALLKTLEEPPEHVAFVLCTTLPEKLPETIISRCTRIDFKRANTFDLVQSLKRAKKGEKREIEEEALGEIAWRSEGSYRDAHKLLEEILITYPRAKITLEMVKKVLGEKLVSENVFDWIFSKDGKNGLGMVNNLVEKGVDFKFLIQVILDTLHGELLKKYGIVKENFNYNEKLGNLSTTDLKRLISLILAASQELRTTIIPQLPLELAIVEWCEAGKDTSEVRSPPQGGLGSPLKAGENTSEVESLWNKFLAAVKPHNHSVAGLLRSCKPASFDGKILTIGTAYKFHFERLNELKVRDLLEKVSEEIFGQKIQVLPRLMEKKA